MATELEIIQARLKEMQDMIEVASFLQKKMQLTDDNLIRQSNRADSIDNVLGTLGE